jgi:replicative DNA helicase
MSGERQLAEITALLRTDDFYRPDHRLIYEAICELYLAGKPVDILTVSDLLESKGQMEKAGGLAYISSLPDTIRSWRMPCTMPIWSARNPCCAVF